jgi:uncharacterized membrane protein HdeD (DUF308 family)
MSKHIQSYSPLFMLRGFLVVMLGLIAIFMPGFVINSLMVFLSYVLLLVGVSMIVMGLRGGFEDNFLKILEGTIYTIFGIIILLNTQSSANVIITLLAVLFVVGGLVQIFASILIRQVIQNEFLGILNGIITIMLGVLLWMDFMTESFGTVRLIGLFLLITGIISIWQSTKIRTYKY